MSRHRDTQTLADRLEAGDLSDIWALQRADLRDLYQAGLHQTLIQSGPESAIVHLLSRTPGLHQPDSDGRTWLHHSLHYQRPFVTRWLLQHQAPVDAPDRDGWTPLHLAIRAGDDPAALYLSGQTVNLDTPLRDGRTPLHLALQYRRPEVLQTLLHQGADHRRCDGQGWCGWYYGARYGTPETLRLLWTRGRPPTDNALLALAERHLPPEDYLRFRAGTGLAVDGEL